MDEAVSIRQRAAAFKARATIKQRVLDKMLIEKTELEVKLESINESVSTLQQEVASYQRKARATTTSAKKPAAKKPRGKKAA